MQPSLLMRGLARLPNRKFAMTRSLYAHAGLDVDRGTLDELVRRNVAYTYGYYSRLVRLHRPRVRQRLYERVRPDGIETLQTAAADGRGVVLLSLHLGDFDVAGSWVAETIGLTPVVTTAHVGSRARQRFFDRARTASGVILRRQQDTTLHDLAEDLERGRMVLVMLDRRVPGRTVPVTFLGCSLDAPLAAWWLARATQALLVPGATWHDADGFQVVWCGEPVPLDASNPVPPLQAAADQLAHAVRASPHQLHVPAHPDQLAWRPMPSPGGLSRLAVTARGPRARADMAPRPG